MIALCAEGMRTILSRRTAPEFVATTVARDVAECRGKKANSKQPPKVDQPAESRRKPTHGRDGQRNGQQTQRGQPAGKSDGGCRVRSQAVGHGTSDEPAERPQAGQPGECLEQDECLRLHSV